MVAVDEEALAVLFAETISKIIPRKQYQGAEGFKPYDREVSGPSRTRRFRLLFNNPRLLEGGAMAGEVMEHVCELRVRLDYAGDHSKMQFVIADDSLLLRDVLSNLKATDQGVMLVEPNGYRERPQSRISTDDGSTDLVQVDLLYRVRYMRNIRP